jgi:hypothetical protein
MDFNFHNIHLCNILSFLKMSKFNDIKIITSIIFLSYNIKSMDERGIFALIWTLKRVSSNTKRKFETLACLFFNTHLWIYIIKKLCMHVCLCHWNLHTNLLPMSPTYVCSPWAFTKHLTNFMEKIMLNNLFFFPTSFSFVIGEIFYLLLFLLLCNGGGQMFFPSFDFKFFLFRNH